MSPPQFQAALYILNRLSPTFVFSAIFLALLVLFSIVSLLMDTISFSKIAVAHMLIFVFTTFCIPEIPVSISIDILIWAFLMITATKTAGRALSALTHTHHTIEKIGGLFLAFVCATILLDAVVSDTSGLGWNETGESSFVISSFRGLLGDAKFKPGDAAEFLPARYYVTFFLAVLVGFLTEGWLWAPAGIMIYVAPRRIGAALLKVWRRLQQIYQDRKQKK